MNIILFADELGFKEFIEAVGVKDLSAIVTSSNRSKAFEKIKNYKINTKIHLLVQPNKKDLEKSKRFEEKIKHLKPDLFIVNSYSQILPENLLKIPKNGAVNIHKGLLPQYRGANVLNWVLINGEKHTGVTLHKVVDRIDAGPILLQKKIKISKNDNALNLQKKLINLTKKTLRVNYKDLINGNLRFKEQDEKLARYYKRRKPEDGLIDWDNRVLTIYNLIRALVQPWPGAFTFYKNKKVIIRKSEMINIKKNEKVKNGTIIKVNLKSIHLKAKDGIIIVKEVEMNGKEIKSNFKQHFKKGDILKSC